MKRLSYNDFKERMSKGLCIHCDEKYVPGHNCRNKQLFMFTTDDETGNSESDAGALFIIWEEANSVEAAGEEESEVSVHALTLMGYIPCNFKGVRRVRPLHFLLTTDLLTILCHLPLSNS